MLVLYTSLLPAMPARPPKKRRRRTTARAKKTRSPQPKKAKTPASKKPAKKKSVKKRSPAKRKPAKKRSPKSKQPKLKRRKLIAPRKKPPQPTQKIPDIREVMRDKRAVQREEPTFPDREERRDDWKSIDPYEDFERSAFGGDVLDEDEDAPIIDPNGDPDAPGFEPFKDLPPGIDVHDYIAWLHEAYDLDMSELYEMYFGDSDT